MAKVRFRRLRVWWMRQHDRSRLWPFCWDCRLAQGAWAKGEFYAHDLPRWYIEEVMATATPVELTEPPCSNYFVNGEFVPSPQTYASPATVRIRRGPRAPA